MSSSIAITDDNINKRSWSTNDQSLNKRRKMSPKTLLDLPQALVSHCLDYIGTMADSHHLGRTCHDMAEKVKTKFVYANHHCLMCDNNVFDQQEAPDVCAICVFPNYREDRGLLCGSCKTGHEVDHFIHRYQCVHCHKNHYCCQDVECTEKMLQMEHTGKLAFGRFGGPGAQQTICNACIYPAHQAGTYNNHDDQSNSDSDSDDSESDSSDDSDSDDSDSDSDDSDMSDDESHNDNNNIINNDSSNVYSF